MNLTADIQLNEFNRGLARYTNKLGLDSKRVIRTELGQLVKTLVRISPPKDRKKSIEAMTRKVSTRFEKLRDQDNKFSQSSIKTSPCGLKFWAANSKTLFAAAADADMTQASVNELRAVLYRSRKQSGSYRLVVPFKIPRKLQKVAITTKILTTKKNVDAVTKKIAYNFGRLKAGWLAPLVRGVISTGGKFAVPQWVKNHLQGLRGDFHDRLNAPNNPGWTLINRAKGVTGKKSKEMVNDALRVRAKAMKENAKRILSGQKEYQYN